MSLADNLAPGGGYLNPFKQGGPGGMTYIADPAGGWGRWVPNPRQQLAQIMSGADTYYGRGGRGGGGYTTSTGASQGGWGRTAGGQRTSGIGGWGMGGRGGSSPGIGMGGRGSFF